MIADELLKIMVCPRDRQPLSLADDALVEKINRAIGRGRVESLGGDRLEEPLDGGLVREDRKLLYPIMDGIPVLLADEAIALDQFD
jgi:uncharacterized protein